EVVRVRYAGPKDYRAALLISEASLRRHPLRRRNAARFHHDLDCVLDAVLGIADRGRQVIERKGMRVDPGGVEAFLSHEGFGAVGCALAFTTNALDVAVVAHALR